MTTDLRQIQLTKSHAAYVAARADIDQAHELIVTAALNGGDVVAAQKTLDAALDRMDQVLTWPLSS